MQLLQSNFLSILGKLIRHAMLHFFVVFSDGSDARFTSAFKERYECWATKSAGIDAAFSATRDALVVLLLTHCIRSAKQFCLISIAPHPSKIPASDLTMVRDPPATIASVAVEQYHTFEFPSLMFLVDKGPRENDGELVVARAPKRPQVSAEPDIRDTVVAPPGAPSYEYLVYAAERELQTCTIETPDADSDSEAGEVTIAVTRMLFHSHFAHVCKHAMIVLLGFIMIHRNRGDIGLLVLVRHPM